MNNKATRFNQLSLILMIFACSASAQEVHISAPDSIAIGEVISITWQGPNNKGDFITIVPAGTKEGTWHDYVYTSHGNPVSMTIKGTPGDYEIRYAAGTGYKTLVRKKLTLTAANASVEAPGQIKAGETIFVTWNGPNAPGDFITLVEKAANEGSWKQYVYTSKGNPVTLPAPAKEGEYEIRYSSGNGFATLARQTITIGKGNVSLSAPKSSPAGATIEVTWKGPNGKGDFVTVVKAGAKEGTWINYAYTQHGNPARLTLPDETGDFEIRYATGSDYGTLASVPIKLEAISASVALEGEAFAGLPFSVNWTGPDYQSDFITVVKADAKEGTWTNYTYTHRGNPLMVLAPDAPGAYELRYVTGATHRTLARQSIKVQPSAIPGQLQVTVANRKKIFDQTHAVAIIFDASGSMLKKQGKLRRIDIAREAIKKLLTDTLPKGTQLTLRAFGHIKKDSCDSERVLPLQALDQGKALALVNQIIPKNLAKTPIADSLNRVADDMAKVSGRKIVILITDGEETCDGNPEQAIQSLMAKGINVTVNIVGFAIVEFGLQQTLQSWARLGKGHYFLAHDKEQLTNALHQASGQAYQVVNAKNVVIATGVVNGEFINVPAGQYRVRMGDGTEKPVKIISKKKSQLEF